MNKIKIDELLAKYASGQCSEQERAIVESWYLNYYNAPGDFTHAELEADMAENLHNIFSDRSAKKSRLWPRIVAAASIVICIGFGFYFYQNYDPLIPTASSPHDIAPGGNKAFLTLADGKRIVLTDAKTGELAEQEGVKITKAADGQLVYTVSNLSNGNNKKVYNTIETPRGGTYQVRLPDGTKVWLNAASTIKYPVSFASHQERRVTLLGGEAYFEVAKDKKHPFVVQTDQQEVKVLGTHFNINSYRDEFSTRTTLLEGSVSISLLDKEGKINTSLVIKPNEQAVASGETLKVIDADTEEALAWKNGYFKFHDERIESVMKKIARWYNVKVQFSGSMPSQGLEGTMSREQNLSAVLKMLQTTGLVKFEVNGNIVVVSK